MYNSLRAMKTHTVLTVLIVCFAFFISIPLSAAFFEFLPTEIVNPDGTAIECFASGDEFFNWYHDENGYTIIQADDGFHYYGVIDNEVVIPSGYRVNSVDPSQVGLDKWAKISEAEYQKRRAFYDELVERHDVRVPHTGTMINLVVYIRFAGDSEFTTPRSTYDNRFNNELSTSVRHYFQTVSYGNLDIVSHHFPEAELNTNLSYEDEHPRSYYQPYNATSNTNGYQDSDDRRLREHTLLANAIEFIEDQVPLDLEIDADDDGYVDSVSFIIRGSSGGWAELLWAHRWRLHSFPVHIHGKRVWDYTFQPENQAGVKTLCHEMYHVLGAPDLYRYAQNGTPVGNWDLMASGFGHMGAWMKYKYANQSWIEEIPEIRTSGTYTLNPLAEPDNNAFMIKSAYSVHEFFVVEYRNRNYNYESSLPGNGLLVYRINSRHDGNASGPPDEVYIYRPNGGNAGGGSVNLANYSSDVNRTEINDYTTNPTSFLSDDTDGGLHIFDIGEAGETITFSINLIGILEAPMMFYPEDNSITVNVRPAFEWRHINIAEVYALEISRDEEFEELIFIDEEITETSYSPDIVLDVDSEYFWRVRTNDGEEWSEWSPTRSFITGHFSAIDTDLDMAGFGYGTTLWGDMNNNGFLDLFTAGQNTSALYLNDGEGDFTMLETEFPGLRFVDGALGDLNNNGFLDIVLTGRAPDNSAKTYVFINNGDETFTEMETGITGFFNAAVALADFNKNGWLDLVIGGDIGQETKTTLYLNENGEGFSLSENTELPGIKFGGIAWGDFNNNTWLDLAITGATSQGSHTEIYLNNQGDGTFTPLNAGLLPMQGSSLGVADYNRDGLLDLAVTGNSPNGMITAIYRNNGDGTFTDLELDITGYAVGSLSWGDFDGNGYPDLLLSGFGPTTVYRNIDGEFSPINTGIPTVSLSSSSWGDFDNDGDLDIAISGSSLEGAILRIYRNEIGDNEINPNTPPSVPTNLSTIIGGCTVEFSWDRSSDNETASAGITYNISIGTETGIEDIVVSMSDLTTGFRKIPTAGNVGSNDRFYLTGLTEGTYFWRVQAVDSGTLASHFSEEHTFTIDVVSVEDNFISPLKTELIGNYPNPFNPETAIHYSLKTDTPVELTIYNIAGQKVRTLVSEHQQSGKHSAVWNGTTDTGKQTGSGIYFYRLTTQDKSLTRKMLMLK